MAETNKVILARAEFWATEAMKCHGIDGNQSDLLRQACDLIRRASAIEEGKAMERVLKAAQII